VDEDGHRFMDFQGNTCHNIGYAHPRLVRALKDQLDDLPFTPRGFTNRPAVELAERLSELWPYGKGRILFGLSGADAIEMAMKLAYIATGRKRTLAFEESWHGAALGSVWAGGRVEERQGFPVFEGCVHVTPFWPCCGEVDYEASACRSITGIGDSLAAGDVACFLAEPIRSTPHLPPAWFWPEVRRLCDRSGTLLIFDEVPTGLGKTGRLFSSEHFDTKPDMTVLGKSLGGAAVALSAVIARDGLNVSGHMAIGHYTHQKNPLFARAGLTVLDILRDEDLVAAAARKGALMLELLKELASRHPTVFTGARGVGLLMALELADLAAGPAIRRICFELGLHIGLSQGRFLSLSPPLMIEEKDARLAVDIIDMSVRRYSPCGSSRPSMQL
jgi:4-aminobutyrate aminotransferase